MMPHGWQDQRLHNSVREEMDMYWRAGVLENNIRYCMKKIERKKDRIVGG
jgi:hypothetical protein